MADKPTAPGTTFRQWYIGPPRGTGSGGEAALKLLGEVPSEDGDGFDDVWRFHKRLFRIPQGNGGAHAPREYALAYAKYVRDLGDDAGEYETPSKDWA